MKCILGIDVGTTTVKAVLFDSFGAPVYSGQQEYPIHFPKRSWAEQDPEDWWKVLCGLLRDMIASTSGKNLQIMAIGVSSQAPVLVVLDDAGKPLDRAMIWMDSRSVDEAKLLSDTLGKEQVISYSKNPADPFYLAAKLLWYQRHKPEEYKRIDKIVQANGYINYRLTGAYTMDSAHASLTQLYDVTHKRWAVGVLQKFRISVGILPDIYECASIIGEVTGEAARETGLQPGIPVIAGTVDGAAAALEAGVTEPGIAVEMTGTSSVLLMSNDTLWCSPELISMNHALPGQMLNLAAMSSTGASLKWFCDEFYQKAGTDVYELVNREAEQANARNEIIFLPYMMGERSPIWDTHARGVFFGLSLKTNRPELARAIMEGAAYALRSNLQIMEQSGVFARCLRIIGGTAQSRLWNQIKADVLNREIEAIQGSGGAPLGCAILAGMAVGLYTQPALRSMMCAKSTYLRPMMRCIVSIFKNMKYFWICIRPSKCNIKNCLLFSRRNMNESVDHRQNGSKRYCPAESSFQGN